mgnify:CR=1 FL=1
MVYKKHLTRRGNERANLMNKLSVSKFMGLLLVMMLLLAACGGDSSSGGTSGGSANDEGEAESAPRPVHHFQLLHMKHRPTRLYLIKMLKVPTKLMNLLKQPKRLMKSKLLSSLTRSWLNAA